MAQYTTAFRIPSGGWTGQANALTFYMPTPSVAPTIIGIRLWADLPTDPVRYIGIRTGDVLNLKVRYVQYDDALGTVFVVGLN